MHRTSPWLATPPAPSFQLIAPMTHFRLLLGGLLLLGCAKKEDAKPTPAAPPPTVTPPAATTGTLTVDVENAVGARILHLDSAYQSPSGEPFTVSLFNYYLSNFKLQRADGSEYAVPESYFLVREQRPNSSEPDGKHLVLTDIPVGTYTGVTFLVGVDEARNQAGAQTGALAASNNMFWTWSQGYIFLKMEGESPASGDTGSHALVYHVGDFVRPNNLRVVAPALPAGAAVQVRGGHTAALRVRTNLLRLFAGAGPGLTNPVQFGPFWTAVGGRDAGQIATNYSGSADRSVPGTSSMFTITSVQNN